MQMETSWDDGHELDTKIADLLFRYHLPGTFYVVTDWAGEREGYLTWEQIKRIDGRGFEIGSHTCSHPPDLKLLYEDELHYEIETSKGILESVLGHKVESFCYPKGRFDERAVQIVAQAGYLRARTTAGIGQTTIEDKLRLPGTVHIYPRKEYNGEHWLDVAKRYYEKAKKEDGYFHLWGHSWEIEKLKEWKNVEVFFRFVAGFG